VPYLRPFSLISACASPYQVAEDTDKFSDPSSPRIYSFKGNGIDSGGPLWTLPVSELNPWVTVDRTTGKAIAAGFNYRRAKPDVQFGPVGPARWLNVRPGDEIVFLADGERIILRAASARIDHTVDRTTGIYYFDFVNYRASTLDQMRKICSAARLEFQVNGRDGNVSYPIGTTRYTDSFQPNLRKFYETEVAAPRL
jgi:hypothetical protein